MVHDSKKVPFPGQSAIVTKMPSSAESRQLAPNPVLNIVRQRKISTALAPANITPFGLDALSSANLPAEVEAWVRKEAERATPKDIYVCDGSKEEAAAINLLMEKEGCAKRLTKYLNCWLTLTDPADVARVESKTVICTTNKSDTIPTPKEGVKGTLGNWISKEDFEKGVALRWPGCMKGRTMWVVPFSMGQVGSPLAKIGVQITDSAYVVASMGVMTHMGKTALDGLRVPGAEFVRCLHSVGVPLPAAKAPINNWPCNPEMTQIAHLPETNSVMSFGSGYGGNSILGKKCLALRLGSRLAKKEGWLAEHMLIIGITAPSGRKHYIAGAFPSQCGKTNLAMILPTIPGYKIECVGDDIAWMKFDKEGNLRAINPENGFFGVAPGTSRKTNAIAMESVKANTFFTNVAETADGGFYWEGMEKEVPEDMGITDWHGKPWTRDCGRDAAHPNSRFCSPLNQLPTLDPEALNPEGVPIEAILFGGRRPEGFPLVFESMDWEQGVYYAASLRSQNTSAAEFKGTNIMHDPFAMRPFFGYNFGHYVQHWLDMPKLYPNAKLPKIYQVNWFRRGPANEFLWPGFGENSRVLDWIIQRIEQPNNTNNAVKTPIGYVPTQESFNLEGLTERVNWDALFDVPAEFWKQEADAVQRYFEEQVGSDLPKAMYDQVEALRQRFK